MNQNSTNTQSAQTNTKGRNMPGSGPNGQGEGAEEMSDEQYSQGLQTSGRQGEVSTSRSGGAMAQSGPAILPPVDIVENEAGVTIYADMPGVSKDRLGVRVEGDSLTIEGTAEAPETGEMELVYGEMLNPSYRRSFTLSRDLDPGKIEASLDNGVLCLRIPKSEDAKPRRIEVKVG